MLNFVHTSWRKNADKGTTFALPWTGAFPAPTRPRTRLRSATCAGFRPCSAASSKTMLPPQGVKYPSQEITRFRRPQTELENTLSDWLSSQVPLRTSASKQLRTSPSNFRSLISDKISDDRSHFLSHDEPCTVHRLPDERYAVLILLRSQNL